MRTFSRELHDQIIRYFNDYQFYVLVAEAVLAVIYMTFAVLMIAGVKCRKRGLMLPYLIMQLLSVLLFVVLGVGLTVGLFFVSYIMGAISTGIFLIATFLFIYFWLTVQRAYKEIGNRDYMYSPAPVKPIYNPPMDNSR